MTKKSRLKKIKKQKKATIKHRKKSVIKRRKYVPIKSQKLIYQERLKPGQVLEFRTTTGRVETKLRSDRKYLAIIKDKKTKKIIGSLNYYNRKTKEFIPRKFGAVYRSFISTPIAAPTVRRVAKTKMDFVLKSDKTILGQIHKTARAAALEIYNEAKAEGFCVFRARLFTKYSEPITRQMNIRKGERLFDIENILAFSILDAMKIGHIRMSSKELTERPKDWFARKMLVTVETLKVEKFSI